MEKHRGLVRVVTLSLFLCAALVAFFCLLYDLQVVHKTDYKAKAVVAVGRTETVPAARGELNDRYGRSLVTNQVVYQVTLDPTLMGDARNDTLLTLTRIARAQGVSWSDGLPLGRQAPFTYRLWNLSQGAQNNYGKLSKSLGWKSSTGPELLSELRDYYGLDPALTGQELRDTVGLLYELSLRQKEVVWSTYVFATGVDIDFITQVREQGLTGVTVAPTTVRKYATTFAAHLLGRTGLMDADEWKVYKELGYAMNETVGKDGVEAAFESLLRGTAGTQVVQRNVDGKIVDRTWKEEPSPGYNLSLTIDLPLQEKVEEVLADRIPTLPSPDTEGGAAVMVEVNTGAVLAAASYPTYDRTTIYSDASLYQEYAQNELHPFTNRALMGRYSPGSTFKMVTAAAGLEEGLITPSTKILDTGRYTYYTSPQPACWIYNQFGGTHGLIDVSRAIEVSCNVFFYDVGRRLGIDTLGDYAHRFGLGEPTGVELPEFQGIVAGRDFTESIGQTWYEGNTLSAAIGQENNQFSPLQLACYTATLANGGTRYAAHLLKEVKSSDYTQVVETYEPQVLSTIELEPRNLAAIKKGMLALGTTGSLGRYFQGLDFQVACKTGSAEVAPDAESNAVFVCFAPADDPQVALAIVVEHGGTGSELAGFAAEILSYYFSSQQELTAAPAENTLLR